MHLIFEWNDETGETTLSSESLDMIQQRFPDDAISVLDFLQDVQGMVATEYDAALAGFHGQFAKNH